MSGGWRDAVPVSPERVRLAGRVAWVLGLLPIPLALLLSWALGTGGGEVLPLRPEMIILPAGTFQMGSPEDEEGRNDDERLHEVEITQRFALSRTEVTQGMYERVMGTNPSTAEYQGVSLLGEELPVQNVSWFDAVAFCNRLSELEGLRPAYRVDGEDVTWDREADGYRLPTEAEWEYAARAGTRDVWAGTSEEGELPTYANLGGSPAPVGSYRPNAWGLHDMSGNVWEWAWDWYAEEPGTDPGGPRTGSYRVFRGGSWRIVPRYARVAFRVWRHPSFAVGDQGFRLARSFPSAL